MARAVSQDDPPSAGFSLDGFLQKATNFAAGMSDAITCGLTARLRQGLGFDDVVDHNSGWYAAGEVTGTVAGIALAPVSPCGQAKAITWARPGSPPISDAVSGS